MGYVFVRLAVGQTQSFSRLSFGALVIHFT